MSTRWNPVPGEIRNAIRELWAEGLSASEIGRRVGKTKNAVVGLAHRMGLAPRPSPIKGRAAAGPPKPERPRRRQRKNASPYSPQFVAPKPPASPPPRPAARTIKPRARGCKWPLWGMQMPRPHEQRFCGKRARAGSPYCDEHHAIAYRSAAA